MRTTPVVLLALLMLTGCGSGGSSGTDNSAADPAIAASAQVETTQDDAVNPVVKSVPNESPGFSTDSASGTDNLPTSSPNTGDRVTPGTADEPTGTVSLTNDTATDSGDEPVDIPGGDNNPTPTSTPSTPSTEVIEPPSDPAPRPAVTADIHVDPINGDDTGPGSETAPIKSLSRAQALVRTLKAYDPTRNTPIVVLLRGGTYKLDQTLAFGTLDSGTAAAPIIYRAYPGETPVISGGTELSGWNVNGRGHWELTVPEVVNGGWTFFQLWSDGERRYRPRTTKNATEGDKYKYVKSAVSSTAFEFHPGDINPAWTNLSDVEVTLFHKWNVSTMRISSIEGNTVSFSASMGSPPIGGFTRYIVENVVESLSEPGEWYLDSTTGLLTYIPLPGEDPETTSIVAPAVWRLLSVQGNGTNDKIEYINFEGITFSYDHRAMPARDWPGVSLAEGVITTSSIYLKYADNISFRDCTVNHTAGHGITIRDDSHNNTVEGCILSDLGAGGIRIGTETSVTEPPEDVTSHNTIRDNLIIAGGRIHPGAVGILIQNAAYNTVRHNDISDFYYSGIFVGWNVGYSPQDTRYNDIGYNRIENIGQRVLSDMGGVYLPGPGEGTRVHHNIISGVSRADYGGWGLYNDQGSSGTTLDNNLVYDTRDAPYHMHWGGDTTVSNNIFIGSADSAGVLERSYQTGEGTLSIDHNILVLDGSYQMYQGIYVPPDGNNNFESNLYYAGGLEPLFSGNPLTIWQRRFSQDLNSSVADPLFVDPDNNDYTLDWNSPAFELGITPIDLSTTGRISSPKASDMTVAARAYPAKLNSAPIAIDFDDMTPGAESTSGDVIPGDGSVLVADTDGASGTSQSLRFLDSDGAGPFWFISPELRGSNTFESGEFHLALSVKWVSGASLNIELRDWQPLLGVDYIAGPSVDIDAAGNVIVDGSNVGTIPDNVWTRFEIKVNLGDEAGGAFDLAITPEGMATQSLLALPGNARFNRTTYIGIHSTAVTPQEFFVDAISAHVK